MPEFLTVDWVLSQFDLDRARAVRAYRRFVHQGKEVDVWEELRSGMFLGTNACMKQLKPLLAENPVDPEIRRRGRFAARPSSEDLFSSISDEATRTKRMHQAARVHHYTLREVGDLLGLHFSTISVIAKRVDEVKKNQEYRSRARCSCKAAAEACQVTDLPPPCIKRRGEGEATNVPRFSPYFFYRVLTVDRRSNDFGKTAYEASMESKDEI